MSISEDVLRLLKKCDSPVSGEELAKQMQVSRNSIWKAIQKLKERGYQISAATNRGYQLLSIGNVLSAADVRAFLPTELQRLSIEVKESVPSTNTVLKELGEKNLADEMVLFAQQQSAGKGRLGRVFYSPPETGLYFSLLLRPVFQADDALYLTTAAAVAVARAIKEITGLDAKIKWVNDVYVRGKKVCGILTEGSINFETGGLNYAVVGIGINIQAPQGGFSPELAEVATALYDSVTPEGLRAKLAAAVISNFYQFYLAEDRTSHMQEYRALSFLTGYRVNFHHGNDVEKGVVTGIDDEARLLVDLDTGEKRVYSAGEVQIDKNFLQQSHENR